MRYRSLIVFRLGGWSPLLPQDFSCPAVLWYLLPIVAFPYGPFTLFGSPFQTIRVCYLQMSSALNPGRPQTSGLASFLFARHY